MSDGRLALQDILEGILGSKYVYFQPPSTIRMTYPCIVYQRSNADTKFADNKPYLHRQRYTVTVIDKDPDSVIPDKVAELPECVYDRFFTSENLNHDVFSLYF